MEQSRKSSSRQSKAAATPTASLNTKKCSQHPRLKQSTFVDIQTKRRRLQGKGAQGGVRERLEKDRRSQVVFILLKK